jgi:hypothetical protein
MGSRVPKDALLCEGIISSGEVETSAELTTPGCTALWSSNGTGPESGEIKGIDKRG